MKVEMWGFFSPELAVSFFNEENNELNCCCIEDSLENMKLREIFVDKKVRRNWHTFLFENGLEVGNHEGDIGFPFISKQSESSNSSLIRESTRINKHTKFVSLLVSAEGCIKLNQLWLVLLQVTNHPTSGYENRMNLSFFNNYFANAAIVFNLL